MSRRSLVIVCISLLTIVVVDSGYNGYNIEKKISEPGEPPNHFKDSEGKSKQTEDSNLKSSEEEPQFLRHHVYRRHYFPDSNLGGRPPYRGPSSPLAHFRDLPYRPHGRGPSPPSNYGGSSYYGGPPDRWGPPHHGGPPNRWGPSHHGGSPDHWGSPHHGGPSDHWGHHGGPPHYHGGPPHHHGGPPHHHGGPPHHHGHHDRPHPDCDDEKTPSPDHNKDHDSYETSTHPTQTTDTSSGGYTSAGTSTTEPDFNLDIRFGEDSKEGHDQSTKNNILSSIETSTQPIQIVTV